MDFMSAQSINTDGGEDIENEEEEDEEEEDEEEGEDRCFAHYAAASGDIEVLTKEIKADPTVLETKDPDGVTLLAHAAMAEHIDVLKLLLKMGANINSTDSLGRTCLILAAYQGWYDGLVILLRNGANKCLCDKSGRSALHSATYDKDVRGISAIIQLLSVDDINIQDNEGMSALHWAAFHDRPDHLRLLLEKGADPEIPDVDGRLALHWAAQNGSAACCEQLITYDPEPLNTTDYSGKAAIHYAAAAGHCAVIQLLAAVKGCDVSIEDPDERTALHWAAATGQTDAIHTLLEMNMDPTAEDVEGGTPLQYARQASHQECINILQSRMQQQQQQQEEEEQQQLADENDPPSLTSNKKHPLGFIIDFFRPKQKHQNESACAGLSSPANQCKQDTLIMCSPVKCQKDSDILVSIDKIQISREDNPVLARIKHGAGTPSRVRSSSASASESRNNSVVVNYIVRSPTPSIKNQHPLESRASSRSRAQVEQDAAEILALQTHTLKESILLDKLSNGEGLSNRGELAPLRGHLPNHSRLSGTMSEPCSPYPQVYQARPTPKPLPLFTEKPKRLHSNIPDDLTMSNEADRKILDRSIQNLLQ